MNREDAEEYDVLGDHVGIAHIGFIGLGIKLGVPKALGLSEDAYLQRHQSHIRLTIAERRNAVLDLVIEKGLSNRQAAKVLEVAETTVRRDLNATNGATVPSADQGVPGAGATDVAPVKPGKQKRTAYEHANVHVNQLQKSIRYITNECVEDLDPHQAAELVLQLEDIKSQIQFVLITMGDRFSE